MTFMVLILAHPKFACVLFHARNWQCLEDLAVSGNRHRFVPRSRDRFGPAPIVPLLAAPYRAYVSFLHVLNWLYALLGPNSRRVCTDRVVAPAGYRRRDDTAVPDGKCGGYQYSRSSQ
jgi:hypothetical protein